MDTSAFKSILNYSGHTIVLFIHIFIYFGSVLCHTKEYFRFYLLFSFFISLVLNMVLKTISLLLEAGEED